LADLDDDVTPILEPHTDDRRLQSALEQDTRVTRPKPIAPFQRGRATNYSFTCGRDAGGNAGTPDAERTPFIAARPGYAARSPRSPQPDLAILFAFWRRSAASERAPSSISLKRPFDVRLAKKAAWGVFTKSRFCELRPEEGRRRRWGLFTFRSHACFS
jgi:hypothetical protein